MQAEVPKDYEQREPKQRANFDLVFWLFWGCMLAMFAWGFVLGYWVAA